MTVFIKAFFTITLILLCYKTHAQVKVAVIGGGMAGVSCAHYISKFDSSAKIILFEKESYIGGNAKTVEVRNANNQFVKVDVGPQYFVEGPWDDYIAFLNETLGPNPYAYESMTGTLLIQTTGIKKPHLVTPLGMNLRGELLDKLTKFKRFNTEAYKVYKNPEKWEGVSIEKWYDQLRFPKKFKRTIIYPFLAASLGTSITDIKTTSVLDIVKLFAFRKPKASNKFHVMTDGMGTLIQRVGVELQKNGVEIKTSSPVYQITKSDTKWLVSYKNNAVEYSELFDFVIVTAHADQTAKILSNEQSLSNAVKTLKELKYFEAKIVLHKDASFVNKNKPSFLNISTNKQNEILSSTMNLGMVSDRLNGIYKSWLTQDDINTLTASGKLLHLTSFYHPLITTEFVDNLKILHKQIKPIDNLYLGGGWSEGLETQNSAVISGKHALDKYKDFVKEK